MIFLQTDEEELEALFGRYYVEVVDGSWQVLNLVLEASIQFDANDSLVADILRSAGGRMRQITETTRSAVQDLLQIGNERGWSIDQLVAGDPAEGISGLQDVVEQTCRNRSRAIARTELGTAQNAATVGRYQTAGVSRVLVYDNGLSDDAPRIEANGSVWTLERAEKNPLQHPNCTRSCAPYFE